MPRHPADAAVAASPAATAGVRLQKVLAQAGVASRRHAEQLIRAGRVAVNAQTVTQLGTRVDPAADQVTLDGRPLRAPPAHVYLALYKPPGYLTTASDTHGRPTVLALVPPVPGLVPVGRLDAQSEGLLLLTTDGAWAHHVSHPRFGCTKEYDVLIPGHIHPADLDQLRQPMALDGGDDGREWTTGAEVSVLRSGARATGLRLVLHEGKNRQIRRMLDQLGYAVQRLVRVRVGGVWLGRLHPGEWRHLTPQEVRSAVRPAPRPDPLPRPKSGVRRRKPATAGSRPAWRQPA